MPHLTIEYSNNIASACDIQALVDHVHAVASNHELPPEVGLRTRAVGREHYRIADGDERYAFIAFVARIGPGRSAELKNEFLHLMLDTIEAFVAFRAPELIVALSGEVQEIDPEARMNRNQIRTYRKGHE
ncbi:MAG: 5-carboxymethyl-2-hydroxymuconate Delta-isomerase [Acidimicrobiales bacterium]